MTRRRFLTGVGALVGSVGLAQALPSQSAVSLAQRDVSRYQPTKDPGDLYQVTRLTVLDGVANIDARKVSMEKGIPQQGPLQISLHAEVEDVHSLTYGSFVVVQTPDHLKHLGIPIANANPSVRRAAVNHAGEVLVSQRPLSAAGRCIALWREVA